MTSIQFTRFFTELSILAEAKDNILLEKGTRKQIINGVAVDILTYNIEYPIQGLVYSEDAKKATLTIGEHQVAEGYMFFLFLNKQYELAPDGEASPEQYDTALNTFQNTYNQRQQKAIDEAISAQLYYEESYPSIVI